MENITGTLIWYATICEREVWLMAHELNPDEDNPYLELGRFISERAYPRQQLRQVALPGMQIDWVDENEEDLLVAEVKSSSRSLPAARLQVLFYLQRLEAHGLKARGEIRIPKEKKRVEVQLDAEGREELAATTAKIEAILARPLPPPASVIPYCKNCAYAEFCWSDGELADEDEAEA